MRPTLLPQVLANTRKFRSVGLGKVTVVCAAVASYYVGVEKLIQERFLTDDNNNVLEDIIII